MHLDTRSAALQIRLNDSTLASSAGTQVVRSGPVPGWLTGIQADFSVVKLFVLFLQRWHRGFERSPGRETRVQAVRRASGVRQAGRQADRTGLSGHTHGACGGDIRRRLLKITTDNKNMKITSDERKSMAGVLSRKVTSMVGRSGLHLPCRVQRNQKKIELKLKRHKSLPLAFMCQASGWRTPLRVKTPPPLDSPSIFIKCL